MSDNRITPLEGEPPVPGVAPPQEKGSNFKRLVVVGIMLVTLVAGLAYALTSHFRKSADIPEKAVSSPDVASAQAATLNMPPAPHSAASAASAGAPAASATSTGTAVPSIAYMDSDPRAIAVNGTGGTGAVANPGGAAGPAGAPVIKVMSPDDAPIFSSGAVPDMHVAATVAPRSTGNRVADANSSLDAYQRQLAGMLENLQNLTSGKAGTSQVQALPLPGVTASTPPSPSSAQPPALFGSMDHSATPNVQARMLGDRSMIVPKGTLFLCGLKTRVISATSGFIGCQVTRNVFSDNGRVLLIERGSHMDGEYRVVTVRPGVTRIPVLWTRVRTPQGVTIDLDSPATGPLGESGLGGYVDNRWGERLGAALMLSLVNDALKYAIASQTSNGSGNTVLLPNTTDQGSKLAEKVLETTINIPPLLYQNQGGVVGVYVSRDLDFSSVYELKPQALSSQGALPETTQGTSQ